MRRGSHRSQVTLGGPSTAIILAAALAILEQMPAAAGQAAESNLQAGQLAVYVSPKVIGITVEWVLPLLLFAVAVTCCLCGVTLNSFRTSAWRFVRGGMTAIYKGKQFRRSVGVQSQTTYLRERSQSRFQAKENGFWQAGQLDIGVPYEV